MERKWKGEAERIRMRETAQEQKLAGFYIFRKESFFSIKVNCSGVHIP